MANQSTSTVQEQEAGIRIQDNICLRDDVMSDSIDFLGAFNTPFLEKQATPAYFTTLKSQAISDFKKKFVKHRTLLQQYNFMVEQKNAGIIPHSIRIKSFNFVCNSEDIRQEADKDLEAAKLAYCRNAQDILITMKKKAAEQAYSDAATVYNSLIFHIDNFINLNKKSDLGSKNPKVLDSLDFFKMRVLAEFRDVASLFYMETNMAEVHLKQKKDDLDAKKKAAVDEAENLPVEPTVREIARQEVQKVLKSTTAKSPAKTSNKKNKTNMAEVHLKQKKDDLDAKKKAADDEAENLLVEPTVREIARQEVQKVLKSTTAKSPAKTSNKKNKVSFSGKSKSHTNKSGVNVRKRTAAANGSKPRQASKSFKLGNNKGSRHNNGAASNGKGAATNGKKQKSDEAERTAVKTVGRSYSKTAVRSSSKPGNRNASAPKNGGGGGRGKTTRH
ncbi:unnamed protein product [Closterium sp. NIES-54]